MAIFGLGGGGNSPTRIANVRITQSVLGSPLPVVLGTQRIQQALLWMGGFTSKKESAGGKGIGGGKGTFYLYAADVVAALCAGPVKTIGNVWSGQAWLSNAASAESISVKAVYSPAQAALLLDDAGVAIANTYAQSFTDYGAPAATVLNGTDLSPMTQVPYGTALTTGHYSVNPASIGTFVVTSVANASGGNTVYNGTFTGGTSPYGSGASNGYVDFAFKIAGFTNALNNGTWVCVASSATQLTLANANGVAETHAATAAETGNTYHFAAADIGRTAIINYVFHLNALLAEELDVIPVGKIINVGTGFQPIGDLGVWYYNPGGLNDGVKLTSISGTPTVAGTYKFQNLGGTGGGGRYTFSTPDINAEVRIKYSFQNNANVGKDAPATLNFELIGGGQSQAPWTTLTSKYPQAALGYTKIALVAYGPMSLGTAAQVQENTFEVTTPEAFGGGILDANPIACILRVLTDTAWGLGSGFTPFPVSVIDNGVNGSWGGAAGTPGSRSTAGTAYNWFAAQSFFISAIIDSQGTAASHFAKWLEAGMCAAYMSEGLLKFVPYGDTSAAANGYTWTAPQNFVVALDDTCFIGKEGEDPVRITRAAWQDAYNEVQVQWSNRANQYSPEITPEFDQAAINRYGQRIEDPQNWDFICTPAAAVFAANMRLKRGVNIRNTYKFSLPFNYSYLEPMDIVLITTSSVWAAGLNNVSLGVVNLPVRITKIVDDPEAGLQIEAEDYPWGTHQPVLFNKGLSAGEVVANQFADPGDSEVVMFEASSRLTGYSGDEIWIGATGSADWGSTEVWVSQDGTKYKNVGTIEARARLGILDATFASGSDPDTTHSLVVDLAVNSAALESGTSTDADSGNLLCYVDGEVISYSAATATGQDQYTLGTYIRRGVMGTAIAAHLAGTDFIRLDDAIFKFQYDPTWAGKTLYFKFQSVNSFGNKAQDLSLLTAKTFAIPGGNPNTIPSQTTDIINPDFEIGSDLPPIGWLVTQYTGGIDPVLPPALAYDKTTQYAGARSLKLTTTGTSADGTLYCSQIFVVRPGDMYQLSAALQAYAAGPTAQVAGFFYDAAGNFVPGSLVCQATATAWAIVTDTKTVPAGAVRCQITISGVGAGTTGFDSIRFVRMPDISSEVFYTGKTLVGTKLGIVLATDSQTALTANYNAGSAKTLLATPDAGGVYKVSGIQAINRAATTSSTMPSLTLGYTDAGGIARTVVLVATSAVNTTGVVTTFDYTFHASNAAAITITSAGYATVGATSMRYSLGYTLTQVA